jgi:hypothetical protein
MFGAIRSLHGLSRRGYRLAAQLNSTPKRKFLSTKFEQPFTFDKSGPSNLCDSISMPANLSSTSRQVSPATGNEVSNIANKSVYATVAPGWHDAPSILRPSPKFAIPFDESPAPSTLDNIVEQVDSIAKDVEKERGYHIDGRVKAPKDELMKILAIGDLRIWQ